MKVGIMSMQRIKNYGSFLQSFGLKMTIENLGHEVVFLDYEIENPIVQEEKSNITYRMAKKVYRLAKEYILNIKVIENLYDEKYLPILGVSKERNFRDKVDVLVIGSDEVFNCLQANPFVGYSKELFGKNNNAVKVISYAASCGHTTIEGLKKYEIDKEVGEMLKEFSAISVRDKNSFVVVNELTGKEPVINVDPVIISDFNSFIPEQNKLKDYIVIYSYANRINDEKEISAIKQFAEKHNKKIVSIGSHQKWIDIKIECDPFELLSYVKNADYIITDTFHGSVFSIKYNIPFVTLIRESNKQKLGDLLKRFSVSDREVKNVDELENILLKPIDFDKVNNIIGIEKEKSIVYLRDNLN